MVLPLLFFSLAVLTGSVIHCAEVDILCSEAFCSDYDCSNANGNVPDNCRIQNSTHSGVFLPFPGPCNCCEYCLRNLDEADSCSVGEPGQPPTSTVCGYLLTCVRLTTDDGDPIDTDQGTCQQITDTFCTQQQVLFNQTVDDGTVGHLQLRELCNRRGLYGHYRCVPGEICYCRDEDNARIFGEIPFTSIADHLLNCACSASYVRTSKFLGAKLHVGEYLRCQPNGDYDPLQCIDEQCFCVDASDGAPTYSDFTPVNITEISNETLPCFNDDLHTEGEYYRPCELEYLELLETIQGFEEENLVVLGATFPNCQLDGFYGLVQSNNTHHYCSDGYGDVLEDFILSREDGDDMKLVSGMNCACARVRSLINGDKPDCLKNGNYNPVQCRRGFCRCVDENGNQTEQEISINDVGYSDYVEKCTSRRS